MPTTRDGSAVAVDVDERAPDLTIHVGTHTHRPADGVLVEV